MKRILITFAICCGAWANLSYANGLGEETVTIRNDGDNTYYEFRVEGKVSEIKVVPKHGPAYYLIPAPDNKGEFMRKDAPEVRVPSWVIFRW